ncbi:MAG: 16S rRNA (cytidine(1402)-2'-O)-methyltransferase [Eubacteriales bacterium]|nr:16S rRNA (cytidine(1402)-2'-O)-methyltransferase [Clostridiales bacterium]MDD6341006.1 16S rRNA (cytidine(1402)-2'-O)-methyltransferase [Eubacteriales bacterium]MDD7392876.1 16S rRNA (cytidine(1402)-2'-O)-methyltransferase [Eubacteriales bacterium]MDY3760411.1 16S rRNA (cytidine(1402)-2'-O)-methyltransferase [Eubacteriales bacterium]
MEKRDVSLYVVATPIGNLSDLSPRAVEVLKSVDFVAAEDTRNSGILLKYFGIKKPLVSYHEHNVSKRGGEIVEKLLQGQTCALVSDAGMPAVSDPGEVLVRQCHENGLRVSAIPGPCAVVTALAMSGISTKRFCFEGFLSTAYNSRMKHLNSLVDEKRTIVIYEAPHKLRGTLDDILLVLGDRKISLVREISKKYEEVLLTTLSDAVAYYKENEPRGEFVLVIEGAPEKNDAEISEEDIRKAFADAVSEGMTKSAASAAVAKKFGLLRRDVYDMFKGE